MPSSVPKPPTDQIPNPVNAVLGELSNTAIGVGVQAAVNQVRGSIGSISHTLRRRLHSPITSQQGSVVAHPDGGDASHASPNPPTPAPTVAGKLVVVVLDHGPGISAENQKRLFKEVLRCKF